MLRHWRVSHCWAFSSERRRRDRLKKCSLNCTIKTHSTTSSEPRISPLLRGTAEKYFMHLYRVCSVSRWFKLNLCCFFRWIEAFQEAMILWLVWVGLNRINQCRWSGSLHCITQAVRLRMQKSKPSLKQRMLVDVVYALIYLKHHDEGKTSGQFNQTASIILQKCEVLIHKFILNVFFSKHCLSVKTPSHKTSPQSVQGQNDRSWALHTEVCKYSWTWCVVYLWIRILANVGTLDILKQSIMMS